MTKRLPTVSISNGASGVGLVTTARVVHLNKNMKNNLLIKNLGFLIGDKNMIFVLLVFFDAAGSNSIQIGTTTFVLLILIKFNV